jgi:hypothetical protein
LEAQLPEHRAGRGALPLQVLAAHGIGWQLARTWPGDRQPERRLKTATTPPARLCPIWRADRKARVQP